MGFYKEISLKYGQGKVKILKVWMELRYDLATSQAQKKFLNDCKRFDLVPTHIKKWLSRSNNIAFHSRSSRRSFHIYSQKQGKRIVKFLSTDIFTHIACLHKRLNALKYKIARLKLDTNILGCFFDYTERKSKKIFNNKSKKLDKKLNKFYLDKYGESRWVCYEDWIIN